MESISKGTFRLPDLTVAPNGVIEISARVASILNLHKGDVVDVARDGDFEYYLYIARRCPTLGRYRAQAYPSNRRGHHYRVYSRQLAAALLRACGTKQKIKLNAGEVVTHDGQPYVTIILKHPQP